MADPREERAAASTSESLKHPGFGGGFHSLRKDECHAFSSTAGEAVDEAVLR